MPGATTTSRSREQLKALVIDALDKVPDIGQFAKAVKDQPGVFDLLNPSLDYTILAPDDAAGVPGGDGTGSAGVNAQLALAFVQRGSSDPALTSRPLTLKTALKDQNYVDLGSNEPARMVSTPASETSISITAGLGKNVTFAGQANSLFDGGAIHVGNE